ncbi:hypothetical protein F5144DRAFT_550076 [Chaetomium tenue]|uniref:Uncharacterized protein n=1 Tax=Chaetomium tenue TaxID=1854479 RepID=A0ACB7P6L5_9PEZI|nr:hypothetical protein F5144DRAFT_550076 [Chaetomium globosum]
MSGIGNDPAPKVANNIPQWAKMMERQLGISGADPERDDKIFATQPTNWQFSSGSSLTEREYLLLRVIWNHRDHIGEFRTYMRNNSALTRDSTPGLYKGYVSPKNDDLARHIYQELAPRFRGYLEDIRSNKDGTRPGAGCGLFLPTRYLQGLVMSRIKKHHTEVEAAAMPSKVWKSGDPVDTTSPGDSDSDDNANMATTSMAKMNISEVPKTPVKQGALAQPQTETPAVGGMRNPSTTDENYVNTAFLSLLQILTYHIRELAESCNSGLDVRGLDFGTLDFGTLDFGTLDFGTLDFGTLDWLADRLPLKLYRRQPGAELAALMEARVDGYLCKRGSLPEKDGVVPQACFKVEVLVRHAADREQIYIIIAEYGEPWKQYIRTGSSAAQLTTRMRDDAADLSGSDAFIWNSDFATPDEFQKMWGPFRLDKSDEMDLFLRRLIALQVQLLSTASTVPV